MTAVPQRRSGRCTDVDGFDGPSKAEHRTVSDVVNVALRAYAAGRYDAKEPTRRKP
jgi:hypothetical protein